MGDYKRRAKRIDKIATKVITLGGVMIIATVFLILLMIVRVAIPLFYPPSTRELLSTNTAEGYVFRVDLRLRPASEVSPLAISLEALEPPCCPPNPPPARTQWMRPSATSCWNCARVGEGSEPLNPPTAMTGSPVASWRPAAFCDPTAAATHV